MAMSADKIGMVRSNLKLHS